MLGVAGKAARHTIAREPGDFRPRRLGPFQKCVIENNLARGLAAVPDQAPDIHRPSSNRSFHATRAVFSQYPVGLSAVGGISDRPISKPRPHRMPAASEVPLR